MKFKDIIAAPWFRPALGAVLTVLCGLMLWGTPVGETWENLSYDYLFRFGQRAVTNQVALIRMDSSSYDRLGQSRVGFWGRTNHTRLLRQLTADGARLVVFDVHFKSVQATNSDAELAEAMRRHGGVVLMADVTDPKHPGLEIADVVLPLPLFLDAATNCGVGHADANTGDIVRRHWPFLGPGVGKFQSLGWVAAQTAGARLDPLVEKQWLRYYGENGAWEPPFSYYMALQKSPGCFTNKIVFIGNWPEKSDPGLPEKDKFRTPYTRWNGQAIGGVEIMATTFLNLVNGDWLRRPPEWLEALFIIATGVLIGGTLFRFRRLRACLVAAVIAGSVLLVFVSWSYFTNYWFPWLVIAGGQVPCALAWTLLATRREAQLVWTEGSGKFPGYTPLGEPFGEGSYGKVWLVRNALGQLQALKEIERAKFPDEHPYNREFHGIKSFKPISNQHVGLLHIDHVNRNDRAGYFYYVMELGDPLDPDWQQKGEPYQPRDLSSICRQTELRRLPVRECIRITIALLDALDFLHSQNLVHRDIKPSNIIFVNGRPKLADVGLVREVSQDASWVGTEHYMPPEPPGTASADIYALGKVLYVISTGQHPRSFAELPTTLVEKPEFMRLNEIICKACQPAADQRYPSAAEMLRALREAQRELDDEHTRQI